MIFLATKGLRVVTFSPFSNFVSIVVQLFPAHFSIHSENKMPKSLRLLIRSLWAFLKVQRVAYCDDWSGVLWIKVNSGYLQWKGRFTCLIKWVGMVFIGWFSILPPKNVPSIALETFKQNHCPMTTKMDPVSIRWVYCGPIGNRNPPSFLKKSIHLVLDEGRVRHPSQQFDRGLSAPHDPKFYGKFVFLCWFRCQLLFWQRNWEKVLLIFFHFSFQFRRKKSSVQRFDLKSNLLDIHFSVPSKLGWFFKQGSCICFAMTWLSQQINEAEIGLLLTGLIVCWVNVKHRRSGPVWLLLFAALGGERAGFCGRKSADCSWERQVEVHLRHSKGLFLMISLDGEVKPIAYHPGTVTQVAKGLPRGVLWRPNGLTK